MLLRVVVQGLIARASPTRKPDRHEGASRAVQEAEEQQTHKAASGHGMLMHGMTCADWTAMVSRHRHREALLVAPGRRYGSRCLWGRRTLRLTRSPTPKPPGGARFEPELVNNRSGVGSTVTVANLKRDDAMDIIIHPFTNKGNLYFGVSLIRNRSRTSRLHANSGSRRGRIVVALALPSVAKCRAVKAPNILWAVATLCSPRSQPPRSSGKANAI